MRSTALGLRIARERGLIQPRPPGQRAETLLHDGRDLLAERLASGATIVTVVCDTGMKYLRSFGAA